MPNQNGKSRKGQPGYVPGHDVLGRGAWLVDPNDPNRAAKSGQVADGVHVMVDGSVNRAGVVDGMRSYVNEKGVVGSAVVISERLDNLPSDPQEAIEVAYSAGAAYGFAVARYFNSDESAPSFSSSDTIQDNVSRKVKRDASYAPLGEIASRELADPVQDAAFVKGMLDADPSTPRLLGKDARLRVVRCVQHDPELSKLADDVCASMWKTDLKGWSLFADAKSFEDLAPSGKERARLFYQSLAADSIYLMKLDEFKAAADLSFRERRNIAKFQKLATESKALSSSSSRERDLRNESDSLADYSRNSDKWSRDAYDKGHFWVSGVHSRASAERDYLSDKTLRKASDLAAKRRQKKKKVDEELANAAVPWWIKNPGLLAHP
jgi:hypothetical protein